MEKVCPVVFRAASNGLEVLAFTHPSAGKQFVKGTVEDDEKLQDAAKRELFEESGVVADSSLVFMGTCPIGVERVAWHFFACSKTSLPNSWDHATTDDYGHTFSFFWHPIERPLNSDWHSIFHEAFNFFVPKIRLY
ncbi:NUDIX hydrolase [Agrobacterium larrymoorei]|uniref:NUDIX domain-containing protein n=1 Tax=Agrobacterium larrymoorei TaxID=160699 RepID=A0A4D7DJW7_9HYPH|nr:NUDIX domain-containing protein [Agrobacterium larrymoorei]QCI97873.1 NUDIX domain-containing protein [Agrobacterium larrymoorei]QYA06679.1 NUDIX domain-containing protein [Agrobacterium larrymoorei]